MDNEPTIEEIVEKLSKTRKVVTIKENRLYELANYLKENYSLSSCQFMRFGGTVHILRKSKFIKHGTI